MPMSCFIVYIDNGQLQDMWNNLRTKGLNDKMFNHVTENLEGLIYVGSCEVREDSGAGWAVHESVMKKFIIDTCTRGAWFDAISPRGRRTENDKTHSNASIFGGTTPNLQELDGNLLYKVNGYRKWRNRSMEKELPHANIQDWNTDEFARILWCTGQKKIRFNITALPHDGNFLDRSKDRIMHAIESSCQKTKWKYILLNKKFGY